MSTLPNLTILRESQVSPPPAAQVSPPPATVAGERSLPLTFSDIYWLLEHPLHYLFFYELPLITKTHFMETIVPSLEHSLSTTLQHFFPFVGHLVVFHSPTKIPEIRSDEGDSVKVTFAECNLDFNELTGYHPRNCESFYHLIPRLGQCVKLPDYVKIPVFSVQVTLFPDHGFSIGMTSHHSLGDATTQFRFLKAWTSIARHGTDESFLANDTLPLYDRVMKYPKLDETFLLQKKVESFFEEDFQFPYLSGATNKVRASFILTRTNLDRLKKQVFTKLPTLPCVSSFTVTCAYIWSCIAKARNDELELFVIPIDCKARLDPPIPEAYFGNCLWACLIAAKTDLLTEKEGFVTAARLIGENLHKMLTDKDGIIKEEDPIENLNIDRMPTTVIGISGTPKIKLYELDFGWGKPKKIEKVSIDYSGAISIDACKKSYEDMEIGVCLTDVEMEAFVRVFNEGLA